MKKIPLYALYTAIACLCCTGGYFVLESGVKANQVHKERERTIKIIARNQSGKGQFTKEEYQRIAQINDSSAKLSDADFNFLMNTIASSPISLMASKDEYAISNRKGTVLSAIITAIKNNRVTVSQREKIVDLVSSLLKGEDTKKYGEVHLYALLATRKLKEAGLVPDVLPLVNDPLPDVADAAKKTLTVLGYKQ